MIKIGFLNLLTIIFVVLKLTELISWSWWLVLLPTLINVGIVFGFLLMLVLLAAFNGYTVKQKDGTTRKYKSFLR